MKIAILGAMEEEIDYFVNGTYEDLQIISKQTYATNTYYEAKYKNLDLIIANSKIGKVNSTITTSVLIEKFKANMLIFTGVAGAINSGYKVGDLMVATKLAQHDVDITGFGHPHGFIPGNTIFVEPSSELVNVAKSVAKELEIELKDGVVATGDQFIASVDKKEWIVATFGADAVEMEGASVASTCTAFGVPFVILRAISDSADEEADVSFDEFLATSAKVSSNFVINMLEELNNDRN